MYPYHALFSEDRRSFDEGRFWFQDALHFPEPVRPFDALLVDSLVVGLSQASARLFAVPASLGAEYRILNGYAYLSANEVTDETVIAQRAELFRRRAGHYYGHWDDLYARWVEKVEAEIGELEALEVPDLPEIEPESVVTEGRGWGSSHAVLAAYTRLLEGLDRVLQIHFELLNLGYAAYAVLYGVLQRAFPGIGAEMVAKLVAGSDLLVLRPDAELQRLARLALDLGVAEAVKTTSDETELRGALSRTDAGVAWLADFDRTKRPWFHFSYGTGASSEHRSWIDDTTLPIAMIGSYVRHLEAGEDISTSNDELIAERERITAEHRRLLSEEARGEFDETLALARTVFPYVENHSFYIEHWYLTIFWNKVREFGDLLSRHGFLADTEDVFYLRHDEVRSALEELRMSWSAGMSGAVRGPHHWPPIVTRRKAILEALRRWPPPRALGKPPEHVTDPVTVMLWGITTERVREWLDLSDGTEGAALAGVPGSAGVAEGLARVINEPNQLDQLEEGEVLVAPSTSPSWTPAFRKSAAAVLDIGGVMSHAAIVAREYGLPAVLGIGSATTAIKTGDRVRVDGDAGVVTILD
jgi:pyruvate,water dikinase